MKLNLIGVAGEKNSGKDTFVQMVRLHQLQQPILDLSFTVAFADPLKRVLLQLGFPASVLWGPSEGRDSWVHPTLKISCRRALQHIGDSVGRGLSPDLWVDIWAEVVTQLRTGRFTYDPATGLEEIVSPEVYQAILSEGQNLSESEKLVRARLFRGLIPPQIFVTDIRYQNEFDRFLSLGGRPVLITRPDKSGTDSHVSESWVQTSAPTQIPRCDHLNNKGSLSEYEDLIISWLRYVA